jgi:hypothetical protein
MNRREQEQAMARDLELTDLVLTIGTPSNKRKARKQRKAIFVQIAAWNREDRGIDELDTDELLKELMK